MIEDEMRAALVEWQRDHVRAAVRFFDSMGVVALYVNGVELDDWLVRFPWANKSGVFKPLFDLLSWYVERADEHQIRLSDIDLPARTRSQDSKP